MTELPHAHGDFETKSACDLKTRGSYVYAADPTTEILCFAWCIGDEEPEIWFPGQPNPQRLFDHIAAGGLFYGHNSGGFEIPIWNTIATREYGWPALPAKQVRDTMAMAYAQSLPGSLENAAAALGMEVRKDPEGRKIMLRMCTPRRIVQPGEKTYEKDAADIAKDPRRGRVQADGSLIVWWFTEEMLEQLGRYCIQDVVVERELERRLMNLSPYEAEVWALDNHINSTGVYVDLKSIDVAQQVIALEVSRLNKEMARATDGAVSGVTKVADLTAWVIAQGVELNGLAKADILELLDEPALPANVKKALEIRQEGAKSSLAKLKAMKVGALPDQRVRGTLQYWGASTGRWTGRRTQTTNLPRPVLLEQAEIDEVFDLLNSGKPAKDIVSQISMFYGPPMQVLADSVRGFICAPSGKKLIAADLAAIEARGVAWLAGQNDVVRAFAEGDLNPKLPDIYCQQAAKTYQRPVTKRDKAERNFGKVQILLLGFAGGVGAIEKGAKTYHVNMEAVFPIVWSIASPGQREKAEALCAQNLSRFPKMSREFFLASDIAKQLWRADNPQIVAYWYAMEEAAIDAVATPGQVFSAGYPGREVRFRKSGSFLWMQLPSKRVLCYPYPELHETKTPWGAVKPQLTYMGVGENKQWRREHTYSGKIVENAVQGTCRDILVPALLELNRRGYYTPQHVYDEAVCEVPEDFGSVEEVERIMSTPPAWAKGFPIAAEGWTGKRYRK